MSPTNTQPKKGDKITLPVYDANPFNFIVEYNNSKIRVAKYQFQKYQPKPETLQCCIDRVYGSNVTLKQDLEPIVHELYKEGDERKFKIENDFTATSTPHYKISDGSGVWLRLGPTSGGGRLSKGAEVICRIGKVRGKNVAVRFLRLAESSQAPRLDLRAMRRSVGPALRPLLEHLRGVPEMAQAAELWKAKDPGWVHQALEASRYHFFNLNVQEIKGREEEASALVEAYRGALTYLLEDSDYVALCLPEEEPRKQLRGLMARTVSSADDLMRAIDLTRRGEHEQFISDTFSKMRTSGYLYRPESRLNTMMFVFTLRRDIMDDHMDSLLEIIHNGRPDNWTVEPFRSAFVAQLQLYIENNMRRLDTMSEPEDSAAAALVDKMLQALAIQQLLGEKAPADETSAPAAPGAPAYGSDDDVDYVLNRARLYRYFTFKNTCEKDKMVLKSLRTLLQHDTPKGEYFWRDTRDTSLLAQRMMGMPDPVHIAASFAGVRGSISVNDGALSLHQEPVTRPDGTQTTQRPVLPSELGLNHSLNVMLATALPAELRHPEQIRDYKATWAEIERVFFDYSPMELALEAPSAKKKSRQGLQPSQPAVKPLPDKDVRVTIVVEGVEEGAGTKGGNLFSCRIVDDFYSGMGLLDEADVVGMTRGLPLSTFFNTEGRPYLMQALVKEGADDKGQVALSLREPLGEYISRNAFSGMEVNCVMTHVPQNVERYPFLSAITEYGFSIWLESTEQTRQLRTGEQICAIVTSVSPDGRRVEGVVRGSAFPGDDRVTYEKATLALVISACDEQALPPEEGEKGAVAPEEEDDDEGSAAQEEEEALTRDTATEIMHTIAREADIETSLLRRYNYFAAARLMARLLERDDMANYYRRRCTVIEILDDFANNYAIDQQRLEASHDDIFKDAGSSNESKRLKILAALHRPELNGMLWQMIEQSDNLKITTLANLVLAYNALDGFKLGPERRSIRERIYNELNLKIDKEPEQINGGEEDQKTEFKTSLIHPAGGRGAIDIKAQTEKIVKVIAGMLDTVGGTLYIGVDDDGYVRGLDENLRLFGSRDKMERHLRDNVRKQLGQSATSINFYETAWEKHAGGKDVMVVTLRPIDKPVRFQGLYVDRQGSESKFVQKADEEDFLRHRLQRSATPALPQGTSMEEALAEQTVPQASVAMAEEAPVAAQAPQNQVAKLATRDAVLRHVPLHYGEEGYRDLDSWLYIYPDRHMTFSTDDQWMEDDTQLTLGILPQEADGCLVVVYEGGLVTRISLEELKRTPSAKLRLPANQVPVFAALAGADDALLMYFRDASGTVVKQLFTPESMPLVKAGQKGTRLVKDGQPLLMEIVPKDSAANFGMIVRNIQRVGRTEADARKDFADRSLRFIEPDRKKSKF